MHQTAPEYPDGKFTAAFFNNPAEVEQLKRAWRILANRYKNEPTVCAYDYVNEPDYALGNSALQDIIEPLIEEIRGINHNVLHFVEPSRLQTWPPYEYDPMAEWKDISFLQRPNMVFAPHIYYHHLRRAWPSTTWLKSYELGNLEEGRRLLREWIQLIFGYYTSKNIPVVHGECGSWRGTPTDPADPYTLEQWRDFLSIENEMGYGYIAWVWWPMTESEQGWGLVDDSWNPTPQATQILSEALRSTLRQ
jgi:aryl-phospho-beta-D-glucosidase BglC (GH1 family)